MTGWSLKRLGRVTRKQFGIMLGAGIAMMLRARAAKCSWMLSESDVMVTTPDGSADCYFVHPATGSAPGVLMWPDIFWSAAPRFGRWASGWPNRVIRLLVVNPF